MNRCVIAANFALFLVLLTLAVAWPSGRFVLVVARPGSDAAATHALIGRAGGAFVSATRFSSVAVAYSDGDGFAGRLMAEGALFVVNHALAAGCLQKEQS
ncbi:hypothetical protein [Shinella pollutisoli]|uniref:Uncharacterized protein n=1 Tax=Shinella pollutisoli TaxID=2250594 RepID=A0ABV7DN81_9HYPH|nr:hypothetical protein [Shinella pollutisoli]